MAASLAGAYPGVEGAPLSADALKPNGHQVGGHMIDDEPDSWVDDQGRFFKPFADGARALRELVFYSAIFSPPVAGQPRRHVPYPSSDGQPIVGALHAEPRSEDVEGLKPFLAKYYGTLEYKGRNLIAMEDLCRGYCKPCVMDCKMGFTTVYQWADEKYRTKNALKDKETTNVDVGFRVSGLQVYRPAEGVVIKPERQWGKTLNKDNIATAFELFASGGRLGAKELYGHPEHGLLKQLRLFEAWAQKQRSFQFFQASVLLIYEGEAEAMEQAAARVAFVDFAHTFQTLSEARDENLVAALASLISVVQSIVDNA